MEDGIEEESKEFELWLQKLCDSFSRLTDAQKNTTMEQLIKLCGPEQLRFLSTKLEVLVKRDFLKCLPLELCFHVLKWIDPSSLCRCCLVSKKWEKVISNCHQVWQRACVCLGMNLNEHSVSKERWKDLYLRAIRKINSFKKDSTYETTMLHGHTARVFALCYGYGMLATGSDDRSVRLWDPQTGHCQYVLLTHTCADISFDMDKVVTASFDNTIGMWDWKTGRRLQCYQGHTGAVFCVDYSDELDIIVSGSADTTVRVWSMSSGGCHVTRYGHSDWVIKVILHKSKVNSPTHKAGEFVLLSMDKKAVKVWSLDKTITTPLATLTTQDENIHLQPRLQFDGSFIVCASDSGIHSWNFETLTSSRSFVSSPSKWLVAQGHMFSLLLDSNSLHIMNNRNEQCIASRELPPFRRSARGSNFTPGNPMWLNCLCENVNDKLVFATSMPDHSILVLKFKDVT